MISRYLIALFIGLFTIFVTYRMTSDDLLALSDSIFKKLSAKPVASSYLGHDRRGLGFPILVKITTTSLQLSKYYPTDVI